MRKIILLTALFVIGVGDYLWIYEREKPKDQIACTEEARLCPDGSAVGRTGPKCEFAPCSPVNDDMAMTTAKLNQKINIQGIFFTPLTVMEDSRCPVDVQCIQVGTVRLKTKLESVDGTQDAILTIGSPITFAGKRVALINVIPAAHSQKTIAPTDYRFEFSVTPGIEIM